MSIKLFTSESVTEGHPDKVCDQVSDAILDAILTKDPDSRVACECLATTGLIFVSGEIRTKCYIDIESIVRTTIKDIGYNNVGFGFDYNTCAVLVTIKAQSPDIAMGVDRSLELKEGQTLDSDDVGAGDQGMMFGFACTETQEYMPLPISLSHKITKKLADLRKSGQLPYLRPDGKAQVTVEYIDGVPKRVASVVLSTQHAEEISNDTIRKDMLEKVIKAVIPEKYLDSDTLYYINPTGRFVIGGPQGDCGLTGRKIIVDTYGGYAPHGGGCFSGKDATKVDRSGAYMTRYIAKNIVAAGLADKCEVAVAYAIGVARPVSVTVNTYGTGTKTDAEIAALVQQHFDMRPSAIIKKFSLNRPIYKQIAAYGHFGRDDLDLPWERLDMVDKLK